MAENGIRLTEYAPIEFVPKITDKTAPSPQADVCKLTSEDFMKRARQPENLTKLANPEGFLRTAVCWWHSRMQRSAIYLAVFDKPQGPKPGTLEALQIFRKIYYRESVVHISGFKNWMEFTDYFQKSFEYALSEFELEGIERLEFKNGIRLIGNNYSKTVQEIVHDTEKEKRIPYVMVKWGIGAHAWLIPGFQVTYMIILDSNHPDTPIFYHFASRQYIVGFHSEEANLDDKGNYLGAKDVINYTSYYTEPDRLRYYTGDPIDLEVQHDDDYQDYIDAIEDECGHETPFTKFQKQIEAKK